MERELPPQYTAPPWDHGAGAYLGANGYPEVETRGISCAFPSTPSQATEWLLYRMNNACEGNQIARLQALNQLAKWSLVLDEFPGGIVADAIGAASEGYALYSWYRMVRTNGPLNFKNPQQELWEWEEIAGYFLDLAGVSVRGDVLANIYYGYAGREAGFPGWLLQAGAGFYNGYEYAKNRIPNWDDLSWRERLVPLWQEWPKQWLRTWFDAPADNAAIRAGMDIFDNYAADGQEIDEETLRRVLQDYDEIHFSGGE
ncbi:MAG: hypothetical protein GXO25_04530 [Euryarchaeota archaeon]|nr:hypothetical protein [Euryarchaeota archaeon]